MRPLALVAAGALLAGLTACTSSSPPDRKDGRAPTATPHADATQARLLGNWGADPAIRGDREVWVRFDYNGTFLGSDGCNAGDGSWSLNATSGTVRFDVHSATQAGCPFDYSATFDQMTFDGTTLTYDTGDGPSKSLSASTDQNVLMYLAEEKSDKLEAVPAPLSGSFDAKPPEAKAVAAVEALMKVNERTEFGYSSLWGKFCGLGTGVKSVSPSSDSVVVVTLTGHGGATCDLLSDEPRSQQLAWTVVKNLGLDEVTPVRVLGPTGHELIHVVPDRAYLAATK